LNLSNYTANVFVGGTFKTEGNLSWLRIFGAGHEACNFSKRLTCVIEKRGSRDAVPILLFAVFTWEG
jgi:hypothetical protein